jgi:hypothetical protein
MIQNRALRFAHNCQRAWLDLIATNRNKEALVWGTVLDAIFDNDPNLAVLRAEQNSMPPSTIRAIREAFELTSGA